MKEASKGLRRTVSVLIKKEKSREISLAKPLHLEGGENGEKSRSKVLVRDRTIFWGWRVEEKKG